MCIRQADALSSLFAFTNDILKLDIENLITKRKISMKKNYYTLSL